MKTIRIQHNHGHWTLRDFVQEEYKPGCFKVRGIVLDGGVTNRLLGHSSFTPARVGSMMEVDIWNRGIYWTTPESAFVDICFCG